MLKHAVIRTTHNGAVYNTVYVVHGNEDAAATAKAVHGVFVRFI